MPAQTLTFYVIMLQFTKRELETIFVHRFSNATMPLRNLFKNCGHYWILSGAHLGWFVYTPQNEPRHCPDIMGRAKPIYPGRFTQRVHSSPPTLNAYIHLLQHSLRPAGTVQRKVPSGLGFAWVTCPNYMFETLAWLGIWLVSRSWATGLFIAVAVAQMKLWANKKEARYRREFPGQYVKKRYGVIPGVL
ncbi:hypothetical protein PG997_008235 [Apiospora hydei]|uniref:3-oxo-5-alpha-steroid 4-dehydrogenase C-terminal domain-containing protein n=1 Tax=Apiospora hydei TaxID=1337664 RepID=A0ABR1WAA8_9PEZI